MTELEKMRAEIARVENHINHELVPAIIEMARAKIEIGGLGYSVSLRLFLFSAIDNKIHAVQTVISSYVNHLTFCRSLETKMVDERTEAVDVLYIGGKRI